MRARGMKSAGLVLSWMSVFFFAVLHATYAIATCPVGGCRVEITGVSLGNTPVEMDNIHLNANNIGSLNIDWIVYSGCPGLHRQSYTFLDGGAGERIALDKSYGQYVIHIDTSDSGFGGNQVHRSPIKDAYDFILPHPCKHTLQVWATPTDFGPSGTCADSVDLAPVVSNPITIWNDSLVPFSPLTDPVDPFPGSPKTEASCSNGPPREKEPTVGCPVDIADGKMFHEMVDLRIDGPLPIKFVRHYDSKYRNYPGALGNGWQHNGMIHLQGLGTGIHNDIGEMTQVFVDAQMRRVTFNCKNLPHQVFDPDDGTPPDHFVCHGQWWPDKIDHLTLTQDDVYHWHVTDKHGTTYDFEKADFRAEGRLTKMTDRNANAITYHYDSNGNLDTITDGFSRQMTLQYYPNSTRLHTVTADSRTVTYEYVDDDLTTVRFPDNSTVTYQYESTNPPHRMKKATDQRGNVIEEHEYNGTNQVTHTKSQDGNYAYTINRENQSHPWVENELPTPVRTHYTIDPLTGVALDRVDGPGCSSCGDAGDETHKGYDEYLNLVAVTDGRGVHTFMTYDDEGNGNVTTRTEAYQNGVGVTPRVTEYTYDSFNLPITIKTPTLGTGACATAHPKTLVELVRPSRGNVETERTTGCYGDTEIIRTTTFTYDPHGQVKTIDGPRTTSPPDVTTFEYYLDNDSINLRGRLKKITNAVGHETTFANYDYFGNAQTVTDPNNVVTTRTFNVKDQMTEERIEGPTDDDDISTKYDYDGVGNLTKVRLPNCGTGCDHSFEYVYDVVNRLKEIHDAVGNKVIYTYDVEGNRLREEFQNSGGEVQRSNNFEYDAMNRLRRTCLGASTPSVCGSVYSELTYYGDGTVHTERDPETHVTTLDYDLFKRLKSVSNDVGADTLTTIYDYDVHDSLKLAKDPRGLETTYFNDDLGRRRKTVSPDTGTTFYDYDLAGNLTTSTDANEIPVSRAYDALNRLTTTTYPDSSLNVTYEYDSEDVPFGIGRKTGMVDPSGTTLYSYDQRGLLIAEDKDIDGLTFNTGYDYDKTGNLIELRYPSIDPTTRQGAVDYYYDDADRIERVSVLYNGDPIDLVSDIQYKPFGPRTFTTIGNTLLDTRTFDNRYQLATWNLANAVPQSLLSYTHSFNPDGNLETITDNIAPSPGNRSFGYDEIHRLTSAVGPWGPGVSCSGQTYTYDKNSNRLCKNESGTATTSYEYPSNSNRLASLNNGAITISYDANGNTKADGTHTYGYSDANRLAMSDGGWTLYDYDGENRRVRKSNAQTTYFFYDPSGRILTGMIRNEEANGGGNGFGQDYIYLPDAPIARVDWSIVTNPNYHQCSPGKGGICPPPRIAIADLLYYHTDHLGTPLAMTNQSGALVWKAEYLPFGDLFSNTISTVANNLRFPGQYFDSETGLHQNWFRDYAPKTGRYQEGDPIGVAGGTNVYAYTRNGPTGVIDPLGLAPGDWWDPRSFTELPSELSPFNPNGTFSREATAIGESIAGMGEWIATGDSSRIEAVAPNTPLGMTSAYEHSCNPFEKYVGYYGTRASLAVAGLSASAAATLGGVEVYSGGRFVYWRYPMAGGGGINLIRNGERLFGLDWHRFKLAGELVSRPHLDIPGWGWRHWPW